MLNTIPHQPPEIMSCERISIEELRSEIIDENMDPIEFPTIVITWDQILDIVDRYMNKQSDEIQHQLIKTIDNATKMKLPN